MAVFTERGELHNEVLMGSKSIIPGEKRGNKAVIEALTADGSKINDWSKMATSTSHSPSGPLQVHFYQNTKTGVVSYSYDYKAVLNNGIQPEP